MPEIITASIKQESTTAIKPDIAPANLANAPFAAEAQKIIHNIEALEQSGANAHNVLQRIAETAGVAPRQEEVQTHERVERERFAALAKEEQKYIDQNPKMALLADRHADTRTNASSVDADIDQFAQKAGLKHEEAKELDGKAFNAETRRVIGEKVQQHIDRLFKSEQGRTNPEKHKSISEQTARYLDLMVAAQQEGNISTELVAQDALRLVEGNVWRLAYQDRVASENLLGDHGIRHLVDHNIKVTETIADQLAQNGQQVKAIDRLIMHQAMVDHDLGYTAVPVREGINQAKFGIDKGHNLLSAKYMRQRGENPNDPLSKVFSEQHFITLHEAILHHDDSKVDFRVGDSSDQSRRENIYSAVHVADNTHAFEDKLPELLYSQPDTLKIMRLMKTAGEIGNQATIDQLKLRLTESISTNPQFSQDDRDALIQAVQSLNNESYRFTIGRICGNKPEYTVDNQGKLTIAVEESAIHQEVVGLYGQESYDQLRKFVGDLTGKQKEEVDLEQDSIISANGKLEIRLRTGRDKSEESSDYQQRVEQLIHDPVFQAFLNGDGQDDVGDRDLSRNQHQLEMEQRQYEKGSNAYATIAADIQEVTQTRAERLQKYLG